MIRLIAGIALLAAAMPLLPSKPQASTVLRPWPARFDGRAIVPVPPGPGDAMLARGFPGHVARFSDGRRQVVLRQVARATRQLHPPRDCFAALGYAIDPLPMQRVAGGLASCFAARRGGVTLRVCERITDARARVFSDVPGWYWPALTGASTGPWLAAMTVERTG
ncbi:hypothetical protein M9980_02865 [Sphingomonas donggukensis]|uniref:Uncharacterized protein n=1 Tax=Sphingomonas donggukensis TaxID=2949093 RepID=A0ABY4TYJ1_9SPHN|nr:hypothetical protein [Sphingomonas donggukensis]URW76189.1 hypothetical protein M9980_02865 [Sphingomonas donggukensis]